VNYQKCLVLFGPGANGKSTLLDVHKLFFKNHSEIELHELDDQNAVVSLEGVSMIYSHEGVFNYRAMSNFKKIVEGKKVLVNRKYIDKYWIEIKCKAMIATNNFLRLEKLDNALLRRMVVIDMNADFRGREDFGLMKQLENEMAGIFNLVISEAKELINSQGSFAYNRPDDIQLNQDLLILKSYIQDIFKRTPGQEMQFAEFYDGYSQYCESSRIKPIGKSKVSCLLNEFDFGVKSYRGAGNRVMVRISL
jgi:putative DNA primase/helicase